MPTPDGTADPARTPIVLWLTDRSRYLVGTGQCARKRYLANHFGPTGYGMVRKAEALPLMTGQYVHQAFETLYKHLEQEDRFPTPDLIDEAIETAAAAYDRHITQRGYRGLLASESTEAIVREQKTLLAGLIYAASRTILPWIHHEFRILQTEVESIYVLDCTCGLTSGEPDARLHSARGCQGIGLQTRQDVLAEQRVGGGLAYFETKTTGWTGESWAPQWETKPQLALGTLGVAEKYGKEVTELYIVGLYKGRRTKVEDPFTGVSYRQDSPLVYGYCKPGNPPLATDDWLPAYEWVDESGQKKRAGRDYKKRGIWELAQSDWPTWMVQGSGLTPSAFWASWLPKSVLEGQVFLVGPMNRQDAQLTSLKRQIVGEERHWQQILWDLHDVSQTHDWRSEEYQAALDRLVPASWECRRFGLRSECEYKPICFREGGWEDPFGSGHFLPRRPHHEGELEQAIERGLLPAEAEGMEEGDE